MIRSILFQMGLAVLVLTVFLGVFKGLQNKEIYECSLGRISENYQRGGSWENPAIVRVEEPFNEIINSNLSNWDASIYGCVMEWMYLPSSDCLGSVRGAFFPLFPLTWRLTGLDSRGICALNYLLFAFSISLLTQLLLRAPPIQKNLVFLLLVTLPSSIIYFIPYTESLFLATMTIAIYGIMQKKYWLYFIGIVLLSMVRPATLFVLVAILLMETLDFLKHRSLRQWMTEMVRKSVPFAVGYALTLLIQFAYSGSWTTYIDAAMFWEGGLKSIGTISDWSVEGFGLSIFALCFVSIPVLVYLLSLIAKRPTELTFSFRKDSSSDPRTSLMILSCLYLSGILLFTLLTSGGNLHGYFRFTLCTPLFYMLLLVILPKIENSGRWNYPAIIGASSILFFILLYTIEYGGSRISFSYFGPILFIAYFIFMSFPMKTNALRIISLAMLIACSIVWNSFLFNIFLSNGYIIT